MDPMQDDDSRTSAVGRKRNFDQSQTSSRDPSPEHVAQRAVKRVKEDGEQSENMIAEDEVTNNTTSLSSFPSKPQTQSGAAAPLRAAVWNKGVQSGLRTSFGNRVHAKPRPFLEREQNAGPSSIPATDSASSHTLLPVTDKDLEDTTMVELLDQPEKRVTSSFDRDVAETALAGKSAFPEKHVFFPAETSETSSHISFAKHIPPPKEMSASSGAEEGEIVSSSGTRNETGTSQERIPIFGPPSGAETPFLKDGVNVNSMELQARSSSKGGEGLPVAEDVAEANRPKLSGSERRRRRAAREEAEELSALPSSYDSDDTDPDTDGMSEADAASVPSFIPTTAREQDSSDDPNVAKPTPSGRRALRHQERREARKAARIARYTTPEAMETEANILPLARPTPAPFKRLGKEDVKRLSKGGKKAYEQALRMHQHTDFESRTNAAEAVFAHTGLSLFHKYRLTQKDIDAGLTYFPRQRLKGVSHKYQKGKFVFKLSEVLIDSRPIPVQNFNIKALALAFLNDNPEDSWHVLSEKEFFAVFNLYLGFFYLHCKYMPNYTSAVVRCASDKTAFSAEEVKRLAKDGRTSHSHSMNDASPSSNNASIKAITVERAQQMLTGRPDEAAITPEEVQRLARDNSSRLPAPSDEPKRSDDVTHTMEEIQRVAEDDRAHPQRMSDALVNLDSPQGQPSEIMEMDLDQVDVVLMEDDLERDLQERYFPSTINHPSSYHCLACGDGGHKTLNCPNLTCTVCGGDHLHPTCSQNQRCKKCRDRGHRTAECPEKLARSKGEAVDCELCGSADHLEEDCHIIWRSFNPKPKDIRTVREIPAHCYSCGATGHFGPECGLRKPGRILSGGQTFSRTNLLSYVDAGSVNRAISAGVDYSIPSSPKATKRFSIKGMANDDPIDLDNSDDGEIPFIAEKVRKPKRNGKITVAAQKQKFQDSKPDPKYFRQPNPPRQSRSEFREAARETGRYGRERTFSPPPIAKDMRYGFGEADDQFRPQAPYRGEDSYRPQPQQGQNCYQFAGTGTLPMRPLSMPSNNGPRGGGNSGRGGRGGGNSNRGAKQQGKKPKRGGATRGRG